MIGRPSESPPIPGAGSAPDGRGGPGHNRSLWHLAGFMFRLAPGPLGFDCLIAILTGTILVPQFMALRHVVDAVNTLAVGSVARSQPFVWLGVYLGLVGLSGLLATIGPAVQGRLREQLQCAIQSRIISKAQRLSLLTFERPELYNALRRIDESVEQRFPALFGSLGQLATGIAQSIGIGWFLLSQDARLLGFLLLGDLPRFALRWRLERESYAVRQLQTEQERRVDYLGFLMVGQRSAAEVRMLQLSSHLLQRWRHLFRTLRKERHGVFYRLAYSEIIGSVLQAVVFVLAMLSIVPAMEKGNLTLGDFVAILLAMQAFQSGIRSGLTQVATFTRDLGTVNQLLEFLDWPEEPVGAVIPGEAIPSFRQGICLEHVSFAYSDTGPPVLNNLCLNIRPGERIALVGRNGAGKSTLVRLILGLYTPTSGRILIDSVDLNEIGLGKWRQSASAVFQEPQRYEMTLRENITLSDYASTHDTERIAQCASICGVDTIAAALPQGFETPLGRNLDDGLVLSGGQWLRVSLARGLYRKASLLVLDEPTSVIDANGETQLYREFRDLTAGRTVIMISHRLGFAPLADRIVVLDGGEIAEDGTHHELLARRGLYATLFETQAQRYSLS